MIAVVFIFSPLFAVYYYIEALKFGLRSKLWGVLGLAFGPLVLPLFNAHRRLCMRRVVTHQCMVWKA